jgi:hypothetical protein
MKKFFALILIALSFNVAQATSLHPCTPTIQAQPSIMYCADDVAFYAIRIDTVMSDPTRCSSDERVEISSATVEITDKATRAKNTLSIGNGDFSYKYDNTGTRVHFASPKNALDLKQCVAPMNGGFSVGN